MSAYETGQQARRQAQLRRARQLFLVCARPECPLAVQRDCVQWNTEVEASLPSVVPSARDAQGKDLSAVRVLVDGEVLLDRLDGRAVSVDPGAHEFRFEPASGAAVVQKLVINEAEKNRRVAVTIVPAPEAPTSTGAAPAPPPPTATSRQPDAPSQDPRSGSSHTAAYVVGAAGLAVLGAGAAVGIKGLLDDQDLSDTCNESCAHDQVTRVRTELIVGDVLGSVGLATVGVAVWLFFAHPSKSASARPVGATSLTVAPGRGRAFAGVRVAF